MSSPTSRPDYGLYESPTNAKASGNGTSTSGSPNGHHSPSSQTHGLISDKEMYSPRAKPGGGRSKHSRRVFVAAVIFLVAVCGIVAHSHAKHNAKAQGGSGNVGGIRPGRSRTKSPTTPSQPITSTSNDEDSSDEDAKVAAPVEKPAAAPSSPQQQPQQTTPSIIATSKSKDFDPYQRFSVADKSAAPADDFKEPKVAWLMSFPNSGTSFTLRLAQWASNVTAATNYGDECDLDPEGRNVPLYADMSNGPALKYPYKYSLPTRYALTKTHCGGRCTHCAPDKYVETQQTFHEQCLQGNRMEPLKEDRNPSPQNIRNKGKSERIMEVRYPEELVARAVHVIRDPFNNVVAR